jgi:hypothetical protein
MRLSVDQTICFSLYLILSVPIELEDISSLPSGGAELELKPSLTVQCFPSPNLRRESHLVPFMECHPFLSHLIDRGID